MNLPFICRHSHCKITYLTLTLNPPLIHPYHADAPIVKCAEVIAKPGHEAVLNCTIIANPKVTNVTWVVSFPNEEKEIIDGAPYNVIIKHLVSRYST